MPYNVTEKTLLEIQEGEWGITLIQGYRNRDGDFKAEFCLKKNYQTKEMEDMRPLSVFLGKTRAQAIGLANYVLETLGGSQGAKSQGRSRAQDDDIPF